MPALTFTEEQRLNYLQNPAAIKEIGVFEALVNASATALCPASKVISLFYELEVAFMNMFPNAKIFNMFNNSIVVTTPTPKILYVATLDNDPKVIGGVAVVFNSNWQITDCYQITAEHADDAARIFL